MTKLMDEAIRQVAQLSEGEQDAAAGALLDYVKHMRAIQLTDEQCSGGGPIRIGNSSPSLRCVRASNALVLDARWS